MALGEFRCPVCGGQTGHIRPEWRYSSAITVEEIVVRQTVEIKELRERIHTAVDEVQRRYAQMQKEYDRLRHLMKEAYDRHKVEMREKGLATWAEISGYGQAAVASILEERDEAQATAEFRQGQLDYSRKRAETAEAALREAQRLLALDNDEAADLRELWQQEQEAHWNTKRELRALRVRFQAQGNNLDIAGGYVKNQDSSVPLED